MKTIMALAGVLALGACGGSMGSSTMSSAKTAAYNQNAVQVSAAVAKYRAAATAMTSTADCQAAVDQYKSDVEPPVDAMGQMAGEMDDAMESMGQNTHADMECGEEVMQDELAHHLAVACTSSDVSANQAEAIRHGDAMQSYSEHMQMRADEESSMMANMMGGSGMMGGTTSSSTSTSTTSSGTSQLPDGTMMSWDHTMPGCAYHDGSYQPEGGSTGGTTGTASQPG